MSLHCSCNIFICTLLRHAHAFIYKYSRSPTNDIAKQTKMTSKSPTNNVRNNTFTQFIPTKVESRMSSMMGGNVSYNNNGRMPNAQAAASMVEHTNGVSSNQQQQQYKYNDKKKQNRQAFNKNTFATPVNDPDMDKEFDFEKNLALFDKQAIWDEIEQKPDVVRQTNHVKKKNFRHDENILDSKPIGLRQIKVKYQCCEEYVTDDGILIPTLTAELRSRILMHAELKGLTWERQCDMLSRGTVEMAMHLIGGARRLSVKNQHQWPKITIVCDELFRNRHSDIGFSVGRQLAAQGLTVVVYLPQTGRNVEQKDHREMELFKMTGNKIVNRIEGKYFFLAIFCTLPHLSIYIYLITKQTYHPLISLYWPCRLTSEIQMF